MFSQDPKSIEALTPSIKEDFLRTEKCLIDVFLGLKIKSSEKGLTMCQPKLIRRDADTLHLYDSNPRPTLVANYLLRKNTRSKERENEFHHHSAVGYLSCMLGHTQPNIPIAVHQATDFQELRN